MDSALNVHLAFMLFAKNPLKANYFNSLQVSTQTSVTVANGPSSQATNSLD